MQEGYQIVELKNRVSDVLTQMSIKVSDVLTFLGQRCADSYHLIVKSNLKNASSLPEADRCPMALLLKIA